MENIKVLRKIKLMNNIAKVVKDSELRKLKNNTNPLRAGFASAL